MHLALQNHIHKMNNLGHRIPIIRTCVFDHIYELVNVCRAAPILLLLEDAFTDLRFNFD